MDESESLNHTKWEFRRRAFDGGRCAHDDSDSAEIRSLERDRVHQGQERNTFGAGYTGCGSAISWANTFGPGGILCRR